MSNRIIKNVVTIPVALLLVFLSSGVCFASTKTPNSDGWVQCQHSWHYYDHGNDSTGWKTIDGIQYYFFEDGHMAAGECMVEGHACTFDANGAFIQNGIHRDGLEDDLLTKAFECCNLYEEDCLHMIELINSERASMGMSPVIYSKDLAILASYRVQHMAKYNYYSHRYESAERPQFVYDFIDYGLLPQGGENLLKGGYKTINLDNCDIQALNECMLVSFKNSQSHYNNMTSAKWKTVGVGYYYAPDNHSLMLAQLYQ